MYLINCSSLYHNHLSQKWHCSDRKDALTKEALYAIRLPMKQPQQATAQHSN